MKLPVSPVFLTAYERQFHRNFSRICCSFDIKTYNVHHASPGGTSDNISASDSRDGQERRFKNLEIQLIFDCDVSTDLNLLMFVVHSCRKRHKPG